MSEINLQEIIPYISNLHRSGSQYVGACPCCGDDHHLYIKDTDNRVLLYCQKCQAPYEDIINALGVTKDTVAFEKAPQNFDIREQYDHVYRNPDGTVAYYKTRTKYADGKKKFTFYHIVDGERLFTKPDGCNCLYNLDLLEQASPDDTLYIVEGEKCADAMTSVGFLTTTANGGANSVKLSDVDTSMLMKFTDKVIIPDNDEAGMKYVQLYPDVKVLDLSTIWSDVQPKQDIADFIVAGMDMDLIRDYQFPAVKSISEMDFDELTSDEMFERLLSIDDKMGRSRTEFECQNRAADFNSVNKFKQLYRTYKSEKVKESDGKNCNITEFSDQSIQLSCGDWIANDSGVIRYHTSKKGEVFKEVASVIPILPTEILENVNTGVEKLKIEFCKHNWNSIICDRVTTAHTAKIIDLANSGVEVNSENARLLVKYIADCVALNSDILPRHKAVSHMGWVANGVNSAEFMPYTDEIRFDGDRENHHLHKAICSAGDFDTWKSYTSHLRKNIYLRMTMAASFASPLIEIINGLPFVFNLWGGTNTGKSVALMIAMSIWGDPSWGKLSRTMNSTVNSMMSTASFLHNLPYGGDELQTVKSTWDNYDKLIMCVCEGVERGRMNYDRNNETRSWKCSFIFTGEEPCTQSSSGGGAKNRVIDVQCVTPVIEVENGPEIVSLITSNYGHAGKVYIDHVKSKRDEVASVYKQYFNAIMSKADTTDKQAMAMALMLAGDKFARDRIFNDEASLHMSDIQSFLTTKLEVDTAERAYQYIVNHIAQNESHFRIAYAADMKIDIWGKFDGEKVLLYNKKLIVDHLRDARFEFDAVKTRWHEKGYLILNTQGKYYHQTSTNGVTGSFIKINLP